ncbi:uncharacterized protein [Argopecten irradians]|uniref:uncharacterized protein n=1 Tax=Argopecten irradians TaxID=31199 RepID=UPI00371B602C
MENEADNFAAKAAWLRILLSEPEKEIITMIRQNPELVSQKISLTCLGQLTINESPECRCSRHFETLQGQESQITEDLLAEFHTSLLHGVCPHVLSILKNYDGTESPSTPEIPDNIHAMIKGYYEKYRKSTGPRDDMMSYLSNPSKASMRSLMLKSLIPYSCTASISAIHIATALGKHKLLKEILSDRVTPVGSLCFHFETGYHSASPFHIAVLHRQYKAISILGKKFPRMACNMDRHFGRGNITPSTLAAQMSDLTALQRLLKYKPIGGGAGLNSRALLASLENRSLDCVEFLVKKNHARLIDSSILNEEVPCIFDLQDSDRTFSLLKDLLLHPSGRPFLKLLVDNTCFPVNTILAFSIHLGTIETTKYLLESTKAVSLTRSPKFMCLLIMATLKNSPGHLNVLVRYVAPRLLLLYTLNSPLYWAEMLQYEECENILAKSILGIKRKFRTEIEIKPPFPALLDECMTLHIDLQETVRRLKGLGHDINSTIGEGSSCLNAATYSGSVKKYGALVSLLLELGADVFVTTQYNNLSEVMLSPLLLRLLWANVAICGPYSQSSRPRQLIVQKVKFPMQLLILRTAHTLCKDSVAHMRDMLKRDTTEYKELSEHMKEYVDSPQPLMRLCRNTIRRAAGIHLHKLLESQTLPKRLVTFLTLKDELEPHWQSHENLFWRSGYLI